MAQQNTTPLFGGKSRGTYIQVDPATAVNEPYVKSIGGVKYALVVDGQLSAENVGVYGDDNTIGAANVTRLNSMLALAAVKEVAINNPKGAKYYLTGATAVTVPYGKKLTITNGNTLAGTGSIVFEENLPNAGIYPIFELTLNVRMNVGRMSQPTIYPEWWYAKSMFQPERNLTLANLATYANTDSTASFVKMFASLYAYAFFDDPGRVAANVPLSGVYAISDEITMAHFLGKIYGHSPLGRNGAGFRWMVHDTTNSTKSMFKLHGCESMEWSTMSFWGYRDDDEAYQLQSIMLPVLDPSISNTSQRKIKFRNISFGDPTGHYGNASGEEQAITDNYFAKAAVLTLGSEPDSPYSNGNNDFFQFKNCQFYNVQRGIWNRQNQAVCWTFDNCQAGRINTMFQFDYGGNVYANEFFLEGYAVEESFLTLLGGTDYYFFGQFTKVTMEDIKGQHFIKTQGAFDLVFRDIGLSFYRNVGDLRPIYLLECDQLGSTSSLAFQGGSFNAVRGFFGAPVEPSAFMQMAFTGDSQTVLNISFENKVEGTGFKGLKLKRPIGNSIFNLSLDLFERYGLDVVNDTGTRYNFKNVKRTISSTDPLWNSYVDNFVPIRDFIKDNSQIDEFQFNNKRISQGESQKEPLIVQEVFTRAHITASTSHDIVFTGLLPAFWKILGVGISNMDQLFLAPIDRTNNSAYIAVGDRYDRFRWGLKPVGANVFNSDEQRSAVSVLSTAVYEQDEDLYLSPFSLSQYCTLSGTTLTSTGPWFQASDAGQYFEFFEGEMKGLKLLITAYVDTTHVTVSNASGYSVSTPARMLQHLNWQADKALIISLYLQQGNYSERIAGGRYVWFNDLNLLT